RNEADQGQQQAGSIQSRAAIVLCKRPELRIVPVGQNVRAKLLANLAPAWEVRFQIFLLSGANHAIKRYPTHHLGIDKVVFTVAYLPDPSIGITPVIANMLGHHAHQVPEWSFKLFPVTLKAALATIQVDAIQHFSEHIELFLVRGTVANTHRL